MLLNHLVHLNTCRLIGYQVTDAYTEAIVDEELLNCVLEGIEHVYSGLGAIVIVSNVDNTLTRFGEDILVQLPLLENALLDINLHIPLILHCQVNRGQKTAHNLMTRPMLIIHCSRRKHGELADIFRVSRVRVVHSAETLVPHHQVHELTAIEFHAWPCNTEGANKSVLNNTNDRLTITRGDDLMRHCCNLLQFGRGLVGLWDVSIHFITIKICVVWTGDHNVETKRIIRKYLYTMTHH